MNEIKKCFYCDDEFTNDDFNKYSNNIENFVKHLGFCNIACYDDYKFHHPNKLKRLKRDKLIISLKRFKKK